MLAEDGTNLLLEQGAVSGGGKTAGPLKWLGINFGFWILRSHMRRIEIQWTSDGVGSGSVSAGPISGHLHRVVLKPGAGASKASAGYVVSIVDQDGVDLLLGGRTVAAVATPDDFSPLNGDGVVYALNGSLTINLSNTGANKAGSIVLYYQE